MSHSLSYGTIVKFDLCSIKMLVTTKTLKIWKVDEEKKKKRRRLCRFNDFPRASLVPTFLRIVITIETFSDECGVREEPSGAYSYFRDDIYSPKNAKNV